MENTYTEPVSKLLELARPKDSWLDYPALGLTGDDIPELIRLVEDHDLRYKEAPPDLPDDEDLPEWYGQIHAWRALAQLKAEAAIPSILGVLYQVDDYDDDWLSEDAPEVFALIGPAALQPLAEYLADEENGLYARAAIASSLSQMGKVHPETRDECVEILASELEAFETNDEGLNAFLIYELTQLKAVEHVDLIGKAFASDTVDEMVMGDFEDVQIELGLLEERTAPRHIRPWFDDFPLRKDAVQAEQNVKKAEKKAKTKRKQEKKSRKKNRKKK